MFDEIKTTNYIDQVKTEGVKSSFQGGVIYRYPEIVPLLEVKGDHYQMGLQYGVLLKSEIVKSLKSFEKILKWNAGELGMPFSALLVMMKANTQEIGERLPDRFHKEIQGIVDGSGVSYETVLMCSLFYDAGEGAGCTGILLKGEDNTIIHGRNNDTSSFGGEELGKMPVIVRRRAKGYNVVTHMDYPLWGGVETGYNDQGLTYSEETLKIREPNPSGFSLLYLIRMALEECTTFKDLYAMFDRYPVIGAYGCVWSQRIEGSGIVAELTPTAWKAKKMDGPLMWNFNHLYDPELSRQQQARSNLSHINWNRETIAKTFPKKNEYKVEDAIKFLRLQKGPDNIDYSWHGQKHPICNWSTQEMVVFDPQGDGFYFACGPYYASRNDIYHIHEDFSQPPECFMEAVKLDALVKQEAIIENRLESRSEKLEAFIAMARQNEKDAHIQFIVALNAFLQSNFDILICYAKKAYSLEPEITEHQLYAGMAAYLEKDFDKVIALLESIGPTKLYPNQEIYRLSILEKLWSGKDPDVSLKYAEIKSNLLDEHDAQVYFDSTLLPLLTALDNNMKNTEF